MNRIVVYSRYLAPWALLGAITGQMPEAPDAREQSRIISAATDYAIKHEQNLPDFICTQTTQRFVDFTGRSGFRPLDLIVERLTYFEHEEDYKVFMVNGVPSSISHYELGGAISSGEFGSVMKGIFKPEARTQFNWQTFFVLRGRRMHVFSYQVSYAQSEYHIVVPLEKLDLVTPYHGLVFIDDKHAVHRITLQADNIPNSFPIQDVHLMLDYAYTRIGESEYLLPLEFELRSREGTRLIRNDVTYDGYRKFTSDTSITFDAPESAHGPRR